MSLKEQIDQDLKTAMLAGAKAKVSLLRGLKSVVLNVEIAQNKRQDGLNDVEVISVLQKAAKQRQESADLYVQGGNQEKARAELDEKVMIEEYLPTQASEAEINNIVDKIITDTGASGMHSMGQVIGQVKQKLGPGADGSIIARLVKEKLQA